MKATICDRCGKRCEQNIFDIECWLISELGQRQGAYTFKRELCQKCYDTVKRFVTEPDPEPIRGGA